MIEHLCGIVVFVNSASWKNVEATQKPHLRRSTSQEDLEAPVLIRPQQNDRGSVTRRRHKQEKLLSPNLPQQLLPFAVHLFILLNGHACLGIPSLEIRLVRRAIEAELAEKLLPLRAE